MANVEENGVLIPSSSRKGDERKDRSGRHSRFSVHEDLVIAQEVAAAGAHIAAYGHTRALFEGAADKCSTNVVMGSSLSWKQVQDRYARLQTSFDREDGLTHNRSGTGGGELSELNELLSQMREARDYLCAKRNSDKEKVTKEEEAKERIDRDLMATAMARGKRLKPEYNSADEGSGSDSEAIPPVKVKRRKVRGSGMGGSWRLLESI